MLPAVRFFAFALLQLVWLGAGLCFLTALFRFGFFLICPFYGQHRWVLSWCFVMAWAGCFALIGLGVVGSVGLFVVALAA